MTHLGAAPPTRSAHLTSAMCGVAQARDARAHQRHERMWTPTEKAFHSSKAPEVRAVPTPSPVQPPTTHSSATTQLIVSVSGDGVSVWFAARAAAT